MSFGYLCSPFYRKIIKKLPLQKDDYRIHFALNCRQVSCPPIAFYHAEDIDKELTMTTTSFLNTETEVDQENHKIKVSKLLLCYQGDFEIKRE